MVPIGGLRLIQEHFSEYIKLAMFGIFSPPLTLLWDKIPRLIFSGSSSQTNLYSFLLRFSQKSFPGSGIDINR